MLKSLTFSTPFSAIFATDSCGPHKCDLTLFYVHTKRLLCAIL